MNPFHWVMIGLCWDVCLTLCNNLSYTFKRASYIPNMNKYLLSLSETTKNLNFYVSFQRNKCTVSSLHDNNVNVVGIGKKGLYKLVDLNSLENR